METASEQYRRLKAEARRLQSAIDSFENELEDVHDELQRIEDEATQEALREAQAELDYMNREYERSV